MALTPVSNTVEFVQDTVPSTANDGDSWLDTSLSPPRLKIFDADAGGFVEPRGGAELRFIGGFELSLASFTFSLNVEQSNITFDGIAFNSDGTRMFIVGDNNTVGNPHPVQEYSLNTAFDLSTASLTNTSFDVSGQVPRPVDVTFNSDGTRMFVLGDDTSDVHEFSLTTAFDVGTASFSTSFDVSGQAADPRGVAFSSNGTRMFVLGDNTGDVHEFSLTTAFDVGTASSTGTSFDVSGQASGARDVTFNDDGTRMFITGLSSNSVHQYLLTTGFDLSTASFTGTSFSVSTQTNSSTGVVFGNEGTRMFVLDGSFVYQYLVGKVGPT